MYVRLVVPNCNTSLCLVIFIRLYSLDYLLKLKLCKLIQAYEHLIFTIVWNVRRALYKNVNVGIFICLGNFLKYNISFKHFLLFEEIYSPL